MPQKDFCNIVPVTTASYDGVPSDKTNQASALINVARNIGVALVLGRRIGRVPLLCSSKPTIILSTRPYRPHFGKSPVVEAAE
jgi:hypothetical protein